MRDKEMDNRVTVLEQKVDEHIHDGIGVWKSIEKVRTDVQWIKRALYALVGLGMTLNGILAKIVIYHIWKP